MEAKLIYVKGMQFVGESSTGHAIVVDGDHESGGEDSGMRPSELLLLALGGCTAMDVISILKKKKQEVTSFEVIVRGDKAETHPKRFVNLTVEYVIKGKGISEEAVQRAVELSTEKYCSVKSTIESGMKVDHTFRIVED
jgi:putative redox protein